MKNENIIKYTYYSHSDNGYDEKLIRLTMRRAEEEAESLFLWGGWRG